MANYFLCGFMGAGKSHAARLIANRFPELEVLDLDKLAEHEAGMSAANIFRTYGEAHFRKLERDTLKKLLAASDGNPQVFSLGGGAVTSEQTLALVRESGWLIFINTPFEICLKRIREKNKVEVTRPVAAGKTDAELRELYETRRASYEKADVTVPNAEAALNFLENELNNIIKSNKAEQSVKADSE